MIEFSFLSPSIHTYSIFKVKLSLCSLRSTSFNVGTCSRSVCNARAGDWIGRLCACIAKNGFSVRFLQGLVNLFNLGLDSGFALFLLGQVPENELEALEKVKREEEAQAHVLHCCVRNVEDEHIETERIHCRQWLQFLELGRLLALEAHEPARLAGQCKEPA